MSPAERGNRRGETAAAASATAKGLARIHPVVFAGRALLLLALLTSGPGPANAQPADKELWAYAGAGFARALNEGTPGGSVLLHGGIFHRLRTAPALAFGGEIGWFSLGSSARRQELPEFGAWEQDYSLTVTPVCAQFFYAPPAGPADPAPMFTIGLGLYALKTEWENRRPPVGLLVPRREVKNESKPGANGGVGITFASRSRALRAGLDLRYHFLPAEERSLSIVTAAGRVYL